MRESDQHLTMAERQEMYLAWRQRLKQKPDMIDLTVPAPEAGLGSEWSADSLFADVAVADDD